MSIALEAQLGNAQRLMYAGNWSEAVLSYRAVLRREPDLPDAWYNLGLCLRYAGNPEEALLAYQESLDRGVRAPEQVYLNRAVVLLDDLNREVDGEYELLLALKISPTYPPALMNLANLAEDRGHEQEAKGIYERLLGQRNPPLEALARYIRLRGPAGKTDQRIQQAMLAINNPNVQAEDKVSLSFSIGKALDGNGDYDNAFLAYKRANQLARALTPLSLRYDRDAHERLVDSIIASHVPGSFEDTSNADDCPFVFVCGLFRSGSTLCEQVLSTHPRITAGGELPLIPGLARSLSYPKPVSLEALSESRDRYITTVSRRFPNFDILIDKRPDNFLYIGLIKRLFPKARILHTIRNVKDNALSIFFLHLDPAMSYAQSLDDIVHYMGQYRRLMSHWKECFGSAIIDFCYDEFVTAPRAAIGPTLGALGLEWDERFLSFSQQKSRVRTASVWQVREPLYTRSLGRWQHYEKHLTVFNTLAMPTK